MRKFYYSLLMLFMGITTTAFAQQEEAAEIQQWSGSSKDIEIALDEKQTYEYTAADNGRFYVYICNQSSSGYIPLSIWGGLYRDGAYDTDSPLQDAGPYENGVGLYGWVNVEKDDVVRFTIIAAEKAVGEGKIEFEELKLEVAFFPSNIGGDSSKNPIVLTKDTKVTLPVFENSSTDVLPDLSNATFCRFVAPKSGVASIITKDYLIYYIEEEKYGEEKFKYASQDVKTNDHEFIVEKDKTYIVVLPNSRPVDVTFKMTDQVLGTDSKFPTPINKFPVKLDLKKGDNYFDFSHDLIGNNCMLEIAVKADWKGTITYMEDPSENSEELTSNTVTGEAMTFVKNVDPRYLYGSKLIVNFKVSDKNSVSEAVTLTLRAPKAGESFNAAITANMGENTINGPADDYWFAYTAETDGEYSFATTGTIKHVNFSAGVEQMLADNVYRVDEGETIYVCVTTTTAEGNTFTISGEAIEDGDYCDRPIYFELGNDIIINGRGRDCYHSFTADNNGFAVFTSVNWSVHFRGECGGRTLNPERVANEKGDDTEYIYTLPIAKGQSYIVEVQAVSEDENITINTEFKEAAEGEIYATAIEIENLNDTIRLDYTFGKAKWFKYVAEQDGFYSVKAKLGYSANMKTKLGEGAEISVGDDENVNNYYMGGYKAAKVYVEKGESLYLYTKTGSSNDETQFSADFYFVVSYSGEARPGEAAAVAIQAEANKTYTILKNDEEGYEQWYTYTIPATKEAVFTLKTVVKYLTNNFSFYKSDKETTMSTGKGDYTQENITNNNGETIGKLITFAAANEARTIYFKLSTVNAKFYPDPVVWQIACDETEDDENTAIIVVEEVPVEAPVIYDLMGRRVENPTKGIYIINGVKRVIK